MPHDEARVAIGTRAKENEAVSLVRNESKPQDNDRDLSDTCSDEDLIPYYRFTPECANSSPLAGRPSATNTRPQKRKLKSVIGGKKKQNNGKKRETPTPPISPPPKRAKPTETSSANPDLDSPQVANEQIFHHSGPKKYTLEDGPVALLPYENKYAQGGFAVQVRQKGQFVGLILAGEEEACRKLLVAFLT